MTYDEFSAKQKQILDECKPLVRDLRLDEFNAKMNELIALQDKYIQERNEMQRKGGQSRSEKRLLRAVRTAKKGVAHARRQISLPRPNKRVYGNPRAF